MTIVDYDRRTGVSDAVGGDGANAMEDHEQQSQCKRLRTLCIQDLNRLMARSDMFTERDVKAYVDSLTDSKLELAGKRTFEEKSQALEENLSHFIPQTMEHISKAENDFHSKVTSAQAQGFITSKTADHWRKKLKSEEFPWWEKEDFIYKKFPHLLENWKRLNRDLEKLKKVTANDKDLLSIPEVKKVLSEKKIKKYKEWRGAVSEALASVEAFKKGRTKLMEDAKSMLNKAASNKVLAQHKVGKWLHRIFKSNADTETIKKFIYGSDSKSLSGLVKRWTDVRSRYDAIEIKKRNGMPRSFHFVQKDEFLDWHWSKRLAYVEEAERRFTDVAKENPLILDIRRELDSEDWSSAAALIARAEIELTSESDRGKLKSMKQYLKEHQSTDDQSSHQQTPVEAEAELDQLISILPGSLQSLYRQAIQVGKFKCLNSLMYNRIWCWEKGHVLDSKREAELSEHATEETEYRLQHGDTKGHIASDVDSYQQPSIRSYAHTGINKAQTLFVSQRGHSALIAKMQKEDSHLFRYWTTLIPEGVDYGTHAYIVKNLHYKMKRCIRNMGKPTVNKPEKKVLPSYATAP